MAPPAPSGRRWGQRSPDFGSIGDVTVLCGQRAVGIADIHLGELVGDLVLELREAHREAHDRVADILQQRIGERRRLRQPAGIPQDAITDRRAFRRIAVEQPGFCGAFDDERQLPGEVERVLHAGVHALAARRTVDVRRVARQEHAALGIVPDLALVDAEGREPDRIRHHDAGRAAMRHQGVDLLQGRIGMGLALLCRPEIGDHPPPVADDREESQDAVAMPEDVQMVFGVETGDVAVSQRPVRLERRALERETQPVPHRRMGAVAADQPVGLQRFAFAVRPWSARPRRRFPCR